MTPAGLGRRAAGARPSALDSIDLPQTAWRGPSSWPSPRSGRLDRDGSRAVSDAWAGAAAAVLVVAVGAAVVGSQIIRSSGEPAASSAEPTSSAASASAVPSTESGLPGSVLELDVITVSDAIAVRDAGQDDRELAVAGWFTPIGPIPVSVPRRVDQPDPAPLPRLDGLADRGARVALPPNRELRDDEAAGRARAQSRLGWDRSTVGAVRSPLVGDSVPIAVVFVGHFDDRRAELCPARRASRVPRSLRRRPRRLGRWRRAAAQSL